MNKPRPRFQLFYPSRFLGGYIYNGEYYDLYECLELGKFPTLGARYSNEEPDYLSGIPHSSLILTNPRYPLVEAYRRSSLYPHTAHTREFNQNDRYYGRYTYQTNDNQKILFDLYVRDDSRVLARFGNNVLDVITCSLDDAEFIGTLHSLHPWAEAYDRWKFFRDADMSRMQSLNAAS